MHIHNEHGRVAAKGFALDFVNILRRLILLNLIVKKESRQSMDQRRKKHKTKQKEKKWQKHEHTHPPNSFAKLYNFRLGFACSVYLWLI